MERGMTCWQYMQGVPDATVVSPDGYSLDNYYLSRPGVAEVQLDLFGDYQTLVLGILEQESGGFRGCGGVGRPVEMGCVHLVPRGPSPPQGRGRRLPGAAAAGLSRSLSWFPVTKKGERSCPRNCKGK